jgi:hypothetical protein
MFIARSFLKVTLVSRAMGKMAELSTGKSSSDLKLENGFEGLILPEDFKGVMSGIEESYAEDDNVLPASEKRSQQITKTAQRLQKLLVPRFVSASLKD